MNSNKKMRNMRQELLFGFSLFEKLKQANIPVKLRRILFVLIPVFVLSMGSTYAQQISATPGSNPEYVVRMGDPLTFSITLIASSEISGTEMQVTVPVGYEILPTTPNIMGGSLSPDGLTARISTGTISTAGKVANVFVKPLCNMDEAAEGDRTATDPVQTKYTDPIGNFYDPILNVAYPASEVVNLGVPVTRVFSITQTASYSHVNNIRINANCVDKTGINITSVKVSTSSSGPWTDITSTLDASGATRYVYDITRALAFGPLGYSGQQLQTGTTIYVQETLVLTKCDAGAMSYTVSYGDRTDYCPLLPAASGNTNLVVGTPSYSPDITAAQYISPTSPSNDGRYTVQVWNTATDPTAMLNDISVNMWQSDLLQYDFKRAYFSNSNGTIIAGPGGATDTVWIDMTWFGTRNKQSKVNFSSLNEPSMIPYYEERGLIDNGGDGVYNDLPIGKNFYISVLFNINSGNVSTTSCSILYFIPGTRRRADICYMHCGSEVAYTRPYGAASSTDTYIGGLYSNELRNILVNPVMLNVNDPARISFYQYDHSTSNSLRTHVGPAGTSSYYMYITLPDGLDFDPTAAYPVELRNTAGNLFAAGQGQVAMASGLITVIDNQNIKLKVELNQLDADGMNVSVAVKANGNADTSKQLRVSHSFDYGNVGTEYLFGCFTVPANYVLMAGCTDIELASFETERASFGWTDITKTTRASKASGANVKVIYPFDDVNLEADFIVRGASAITATTNLTASVSYNSLASGTGNAFLVKNPSLPNPGLLVYTRNGTPMYINIPAASITTRAVTVGSGSTAIHTQFMEVNIAALLYAQGITSLSANDEIKLTIYARSNDKLPTTNDAAGRPVKIELFREGTTVCYPMIDNDVKMVRYSFDLLLTDDSDNSMTWYENAQSTTCDLFYGYNKMLGGPNMLTGGEYRPNIDNFSSLTFEIKSLVKINRIRIALTNPVTGNESNQSPVDPSKYTVTYSNGVTKIVIDPLKDHMFTGINGSGWVGYRIYFDWDAVNVINNFFAAANKTVQFTCTEYPTSAAPINRTFNKGIGHDYNTSYFYNMALSSPAPIQAPTTSIVEWPIKIENTSQWAASDGVFPNSWIAFECPAGITPYRLLDASNNVIAEIDDVSSTYPYQFEQYGSTGNHYWVKLGSVNASAPVSYKIQCTYSICMGTPGFNIKYGLSKIDYPQNPADGYSQAPYNSPSSSMDLKHSFTTAVSFVPPVVDFSGTLVHTPTYANGTDEFCDEVDFTATFINGLGTNVSNMRLRINLPDGFDYSGASVPQVRLGNGTWQNVKSVSQIGRLFEIILGDLVELTPYGETTSRAEVTFQLRISCGMQDRASVYADFIGESGCGASTTKRYNSGQVRVAGLSVPPDYFIENINYTQDFFTGADDATSGTVVISGTYKLAGNATGADMAVIDIPENMTLVDQSGQLWFNQTGTRLTAKFAYPAMIGRTYNYNITLLPQNPEVWDSQQEHCVYMGSGVIDTLECDGLRCPMLSMSDIVDSVCFTMKKLVIDFNGNPTAVSRYNDPATERVVIEGSLINLGDVDAGRLTIDLMTFNGIDYVEVANIVSGNTVSGILSNGGTTPFKITANVHHLEDVCNLLLVLRKYNTTVGSVNAYLADSVAIPVPVPNYEISAEVDEMCQIGSSVVIGELPINDYSYRWNPSDYLSRSTVARPSFTYDYLNNPLPDDTVLEYFVSIIRPNGCITVDTIFVPIKGMPSVDDISDMTLCSGSPFSLAFSDATNSGLGAATTYSWKIENGPTVGLPASGQAGSISVSSVRNTTTQPVTLLGEVTPYKEGCPGVTKYFVITVNPALQIDYINSETYCHGTLVYPRTFGGNVQSADYKWEYVSGTNVLGSASGTNMIPSFIASNTGNSPVTGTYKAYAEYTNNGVTCRSSEISFTITVMPEIKVLVSTPSQELCSGDNLTAINFSNTLTGGTSTFAWSLQTGQIPGLSIAGNGNISGGQALVNSTQNSLTATYLVTPSYTYGGYTCSGNPEVFTVTVNPKPSLYAIPDFTYCNGQQVGEYAFSGNNQNSVMSWTRTSGSNIGLSATSGTGNFPAFIAVNNGTTDLSATYSVTMTYASCTSTDDFTITVKPTPYVNTVNDLSICSGNNININFSGLADEYQWIKTNGSNIPGVDMSGTGNMNFTGVTINSTNSVYAEYSVTPKLGQCQGSPATFRITVYPAPVLTSPSNAGTLCSGEAFQYTAASSTTGVDFSWTRATNASINGGLAGSGNSAVINETLVNTSTSPVVVTYTINMSQGLQCPKTETVTVTINPVPDFVLTSAIAEICSGATSIDLTYTTTNTPSDLRYDIAFSNAARAAGFVNVSNTTVPAGQITVPLPSNVSSGTYSGTLKIYFSTNSDCYMSYPFEISIVATPVLSPIASNFYCSGTSVPEMQIRGNVSTAEITWLRTGGVAIPGLLNSGTAAFPSFVASNTGSTMLTAEYTATMTSYGLTGLTCYDTEMFSIEIAPEQTVNSIDDIEKCNGEALSVVFSGSGQVYEWSRVSGSSALGIPQSGTGNITVSYLTNNTASTLSTVYRVRPKFVHPIDGTKVCYGAEATFNILVYPTPALTSNTDAGAVCSGSTFGYTATTSSPDVIFSWTRAAITGINGGASGSGNSEVISEVLTNSTNAPINVVYEFTMSINGNCSTTANVSVSVDPTVDFVLDNPRYILCSGSAATIDMDYTSSNDPSDLTYTISFSDAARGVGFVNITTPVVLPSSPIVVNLPANTIAGNYTGTLNVQYAGSTSCIGSYNFEIIVVAQPSLNPIQNMVYCNGTTVSALVFHGVGDGVVTWTKTSGDAISGLSTSGYNQMPAFNAANTGIAPLTASYEVVMTNSYGQVSCTDTSSFTITVDPSPEVNPINDIVICNNDPLNISFTGTGSDYIWSRVSGAVITGLTGGNGNISLASINNTGTMSLTTTLKVVPQSTSGTCPGNEETFSVTIMPTPALISPTNAGSVCSGERFEYTALSSTADAGFTWTRVANPAINGGTSNSGNYAAISEVLTSTSNTVVTVTYEISMTMGSCTDVEYVTVDVDPVVDFSLTTSRYSTCSNETGISLLYSGGSNPSELEYSIIFSDEARGTGFQNISAYTGVPTGGSINVPIPANALAGTYSGTLYVRYIANPACVREYTFQVNIVAQPVLTPVSSFTYCHGTAVPVLQLTSNVSNASIEWERVLTSDAIQGLPDNGRNSIPQFTANNDGTSTITADYKYRITTTDGISSCSDSSTFSISIIPVQIVDAIDEIELCTGDTLNLHFTGTAGQYSWSRESGSSTLGLPQSGTGDIIDVELINTTTNIISAAYKVIPKSGTGTCIGSEERFTLTVYPDPVLDNVTETVICSGETFAYTARSSTEGIVYSWERTPACSGHQRRLGLIRH